MGRSVAVIHRDSADERASRPQAGSPRYVREPMAMRVDCAEHSLGSAPVRPKITDQCTRQVPKMAVLTSRNLRCGP
jgi:hypothetical protein